MRQNDATGRLIARFATVCALCVAMPVVSGCGTTKPKMAIHHAEVTGVQLGLPLSVGVNLNIVLAVYNPNSFDIQIRSFNGQAVVNNRYPFYVNIAPNLWLPSKQTVLMTVPVTMPASAAMQIMSETLNSPAVPYRVTGKANVTATSSLGVKVDDVEVDEQGLIQRQAVVEALRRIGLNAY